MLRPFIIITSFLSLSVYAQDVIVPDPIEESVPRVELGLKAGINYTSLLINANSSFSSDSKVGYAGGAFVTLAFNKYLGVKAEVLISQKGFSGSNQVDSSSYIFTRSASYIDVPLLLQIKPTKWLAIVAGPQYSYFAFKADRVKGNDYDMAKDVKKENEKISYNNFGACAGLEFTFKRVWVWARYNVDFETNNGSGTSSLPAYRNQVYQLGVGYSFFRF